MPSMVAMTDAEIADALNHVIATPGSSKAVPFKPAEIAAVQAAGKVSGTHNNGLRATLVAEGKIKQDWQPLWSRSRCGRAACCQS